MKKCSIILLTLVIMSVLVGCGSSSLRPNEEGIYEISFNKGLTKTEMNELDGKEIEITGFYSISDYNFATFQNNGDLAYIMSDPYHFCLYCTEDAPHSFSNTLAMYKAEGMEFEFTDLPITVRGKFKVEETDDMYGNHYNYMITDVVVKETDESKIINEVKIYTDIVNKGFLNPFNEYMNQIAYLTDFNSLGLATSQLEKIDMDLVEDLKVILENGSNKDYKDIYEVVIEAESLGLELNKLFEEKAYNIMPTKKSNALEIYDKFHKWLTKPHL